MARFLHSHIEPLSSHRRGNGDAPLPIKSYLYRHLVSTYFSPPLTILIARLSIFLLLANGIIFSNVLTTQASASGFMEWSRRQETTTTKKAASFSETISPTTNSSAASSSTVVIASAAGISVIQSGLLTEVVDSETGVVIVSHNRTAVTEAVQTESNASSSPPLPFTANVVIMPAETSEGLFTCLPLYKHQGEGNVATQPLWCAVFQMSEVGGGEDGDGVSGEATSHPQLLLPNGTIVPLLPHSPSASSSVDADAPSPWRCSAAQPCALISQEARPVSASVGASDYGGGGGAISTTSDGCFRRGNSSATQTNRNDLGPPSSSASASFNAIPVQSTHVTVAWNDQLFMFRPLVVSAQSTLSAALSHIRQVPMPTINTMTTVPSSAAPTPTIPTLQYLTIAFPLGSDGLAPNTTPTTAANGKRSVRGRKGGGKSASAPSPSSSLFAKQGAVCALVMTFENGTLALFDSDRDDDGSHHSDVDDVLATGLNPFALNVTLSGVNPSLPSTPQPSCQMPSLSTSLRMLPFYPSRLEEGGNTEGEGKTSAQHQQHDLVFSTILTMVCNNDNGDPSSRMTKNAAAESTTTAPVGGYMMEFTAPLAPSSASGRDWQSTPIIVGSFEAPLPFAMPPSSSATQRRAPLVTAMVATALIQPLVFAESTNLTQFSTVSAYTTGIALSYFNANRIISGGGGGGGENITAATVATLVFRSNTSSSASPSSSLQSWAYPTLTAKGLGASAFSAVNFQPTSSPPRSSPAANPPLLGAENEPSAAVPIASLLGWSIANRLTADVNVTDPLAPTTPATTDWNNAADGSDDGVAAAEAEATRLAAEWIAREGMALSVLANSMFVLMNGTNGTPSTPLTANSLNDNNAAAASPTATAVVSPLPNKPSPILSGGGLPSPPSRVVRRYYAVSGPQPIRSWGSVVRGYSLDGESSSSSYIITGSGASSGRLGSSSFSLSDESVLPSSLMMTSTVISTVCGLGPSNNNTLSGPSACMYTLSPHHQFIGDVRLRIVIPSTLSSSSSPILGNHDGLGQYYSLLWWSIDDDDTSSSQSLVLRHYTLSFCQAFSYPAVSNADQHGRGGYATLLNATIVPAVTKALLVTTTTTAISTSSANDAYITASRVAAIPLDTVIGKTTVINLFDPRLLSSSRKGKANRKASDVSNESENSIAILETATFVCSGEVVLIYDTTDIYPSIPQSVVNLTEEVPLCSGNSDDNYHSSATATRMSVRGGNSSKCRCTKAILTPNDEYFFGLAVYFDIDIDIDATIGPTPTNGTNTTTQQGMLMLSGLSPMSFVPQSFIIPSVEVLITQLCQHANDDNNNGGGGGSSSAPLFSMGDPTLLHWNDNLAQTIVPLLGTTCFLQFGGFATVDLFVMPIIGIGLLPTITVTPKGDWVLMTAKASSPASTTTTTSNNINLFGSYSILGLQRSVFLSEMVSHSSATTGPMPSFQINNVLDSISINGILFVLCAERNFATRDVYITFMGIDEKDMATIAKSIAVTVTVATFPESETERVAMIPQMKLFKLQRWVCMSIGTLECFSASTTDPTPIPIPSLPTTSAAAAATRRRANPHTTPSPVYYGAPAQDSSGNAVFTVAAEGGGGGGGIRAPCHALRMLPNGTILLLWDAPWWEGEGQSTPEREGRDGGVEMGMNRSACSAAVIISDGVLLTCRAMREEGTSDEIPPPLQTFLVQLETGEVLLGGGPHMSSTSVFGAYLSYALPPLEEEEEEEEGKGDSNGDLAVAVIALAGSYELLPVVVDDWVCFPNLIDEARGRFAISGYISPTRVIGVKTPFDAVFSPIVVNITLNEVLGRPLMGREYVGYAGLRLSRAVAMPDWPLLQPLLFPAIQFDNVVGSFFLIFDGPTVTIADSVGTQYTTACEVCTSSCPRIQSIAFDTNTQYLYSLVPMTNNFEVTSAATGNSSFGNPTIIPIPFIGNTALAMARMTIRVSGEQQLTESGAFQGIVWQTQPAPLGRYCAMTRPTSVSQWTTIEIGGAKAAPFAVVSTYTIDASSALTIQYRSVVSSNPVTALSTPESALLNLTIADLLNIATVNQAFPNTDGTGQMLAPFSGVTLMPNFPVALTAFGQTASPDGIAKFELDGNCWTMDMIVPVCHTTLLESPMDPRVRSVVWWASSTPSSTAKEDKEDIIKSNWGNGFVAANFAVTLPDILRKIDETSTPVNCMATVSAPTGCYTPCNPTTNCSSQIGAYLQQYLHTVGTMPIGSTVGVAASLAASCASSPSIVKLLSAIEGGKRTGKGRRKGPNAVHLEISFGCTANGTVVLTAPIDGIGPAVVVGEFDQNVDIAAVGARFKCSTCSFFMVYGVSSQPLAWMAGGAVKTLLVTLFFYFSLNYFRTSYRRSVLQGVDRSDGASHPSSSPSRCSRVVAACNPFAIYSWAVLTLSRMFHPSVALAFKRHMDEGLCPRQVSTRELIDGLATILGIPTAAEDVGADDEDREKVAILREAVSSFGGFYQWSMCKDRSVLLRVAIDPAMHTTADGVATAEIQLAKLHRQLQDVFAVFCSVYGVSTTRNTSSSSIQIPAAVAVGEGTITAVDFAADAVNSYESFAPKESREKLRSSNKRFKYVTHRQSEAERPMGSATFPPRLASPPGMGLTIDDCNPLTFMANISSSSLATLPNGTASGHFTAQLRLLAERADPSFGPQSPSYPTFTMLCSLGKSMLAVPVELLLSRGSDGDNGREGHHGTPTLPPPLSMVEEWMAQLTVVLVTMARAHQSPPQCALTSGDRAAISGEVREEAMRLFDGVGTSAHALPPRWQTVFDHMVRGQSDRLAQPPLPSASRAKLEDATPYSSSSALLAHPVSKLPAFDSFIWVANSSAVNRPSVPDGNHTQDAAALAYELREAATNFSKQIHVHPESFEVVQLPSRIVDDQLTPNPLFLTIGILQAVVVIIIYSVNVSREAPRLSGFDVYQCVSFCLFNSSLPASLIVSSLARADLMPSSRGTPSIRQKVKDIFGNPYVRIVLAIFAAPLITHVLPGMVLYAWLTIPPLAAVLALTWATRSHGNVLLRMFIRVLALFAVAAVASVSYNYAAMSLWLPENGPLNTGSFRKGLGYFQTIENDWDERRFLCLWEHALMSVSNIFQLGILTV